MATHETGDLRCPHCGRLGDRQTNAQRGEHGGPVAGAYTLCIYCGEVSRFTARLRLRKATPAEARELRAREPRMFEAFAWVRQFARRRGLLK